MKPYGGDILLMGLLVPAVNMEIRNVTEASLDLFYSELSWSTRIALQHETITKKNNKRSSTIVAAQVEGKREPTAAEAEELAAIRAEIKRLDAEQNRTITNALVLHSQELMFGGKHAAKTFATLARILAHWAAAPGGVTFRGFHWCIGSNHMGIRQENYGPCDAECEQEKEGVA